MLTVKEAIKSRRSTRDFLSDPIPDEIVGELLEAARLAPSAGNLQPWRFLIVRDEERKRALQEAAYQPFIHKAPLVFICCADLFAFSKNNRKERLQELIDCDVVAISNLEEHLEKFPGIGVFDSKEDSFKALGQAMLNVAISVEHIVLLATSIGLGTCWVQRIDCERIKQSFRLPDNIIVIALLLIGYTKSNNPQRPRFSKEEILLDKII